jgi:hypothetical protein
MTHMRHCPPLDPDVSDTAPFDPALAVYDEEHLITYLRLLDADAEGADWREVARIVPHIDPQHESDRARRAVYSRLSRVSELLQSPRSGTTRGARRIGRLNGLLRSPTSLTSLGMGSICAVRSCWN